MKKSIALALLVLSATSCDNKDKPLSFTPIFANNSNIFGFDVLQGAIKSFTQRMTHQDGKLIALYVAEINRGGCFTSIDSTFAEVGVKVKYVKEGSYYINDKTKVRSYKLDDKCNITQPVNSREEYTINERGFLMDIKNSSTGKISNRYEYDENGFPSVQSNQVAGVESQYVSVFSSKEKAPFNYTTKVYVNKKIDVVLTRNCKVDDHANPVSCEMTEKNTDGSVKVYTVSYDIKYF